MNIKLSVIVPCYNVAQYLEGFFACLDKQWGEHDHYEVVFVNDGSTDSTPSLLAEYVAADTRHRVLINQANQGVSGARNAGIQAARGEWIAFADPDDLLADGAYALLMSKWLDGSIDMLSFKTVKVEENESLDLSQSLSGNVIWEGCTHKKFDILLPSVWNCVYRKDMVEQYKIRFRVETSFAEDALFNADIFSKGIKIRMVDALIYFYVQHPQSICNTGDMAKLRKSIEGLIFCADEVRTFSNPNYSTNHWVKFFMVFIVSHLMRGNFSVAEVRQIRDRLMAIGVFPLTSPWRTERLYFTALAHPWLLPLVRTTVRVKHSLKKG